MGRQRKWALAMPLCAGLLLAAGGADAQSSKPSAKAQVIAQVSRSYIGRLAWCGVDIDEIKSYYETRIVEAAVSEDDERRAIRTLDISIATALRASASAISGGESCDKVRAAGWQAFRRAIDQFVGG